MRHPNALVPWFLMLSHLYYHRDTAHVSDSYYDDLCKLLLARWDQIDHDHKRLIDKESLKAGTGFYLKEEDLPLITKNCSTIVVTKGIKPPDLRRIKHVQSST